MEKLTMNENKRLKNFRLPSDEPSFGGAVLRVSIAILVVVGLFVIGNLVLGWN